MGFYITAWTALAMTFVLASCQTEEEPVVCSVIKGLYGRDGRDGIPGQKGEPGMPGEMGSPGLKGSLGTPGKAGPQGQKGDQGDKGADGKPGLQGPKGEKGLVGPSGATGAVGAPGPKGASGSIGPAGSPGVIGTPGAKGEKGDLGVQGLKGERGPPGANGASGAAGVAGAKGASGAPGSTGIAGIKGSAGAKGDPGTQGIKGDRGPAGPAGAAGSKGATGAPGAIGAKGDSAINLENKIAALERNLASLKKVCYFQGRVEVSGNKIYVSNGIYGNYDAAHAFCKDAQGTLPAPMNSAENAALLKIFKASNQYFFLGINDIKEEGTFVYPNGNPISYLNWRPNDPNGGRDENCVGMEQDGKWNDWICDGKNVIVCEFS